MGKCNIKRFGAIKSRKDDIIIICLKIFPAIVILEYIVYWELLNSND